MSERKKNRGYPTQGKERDVRQFRSFEELAEYNRQRDQKWYREQEIRRSSQQIEKHFKREN